MTNAFKCNACGKYVDGKPQCERRETIAIETPSPGEYHEVVVWVEVQSAGHLADSPGRDLCPDCIKKAIMKWAE